MQKKIIALAIAGLASTAAFAQTNVTIYGVADATFDYVSATGTVVQNAPSGQADFKARNRISSSSSFIGFKGVEDLGNGLKAVFQIENGINLDNGGGTAGANGGSWANRDSYVGLSGGFGTLVMGNLTGPTRGLGAKMDVNAGATGIGSNNALIGKLAGQGNGASYFDQRLNNAVAYISPTMAGFNAVVGYTAGSSFATNNTINGFMQTPGAAENAPAGNTVRGNQGYTLGLNFAGGPVEVGYAYTVVQFTTDGRANNANVIDDVSNHRAGVIGKIGTVAQINAMVDYTQANVSGLGKTDQFVYYVGGKVFVGKGAIIGQYGLANDIRGTLAQNGGETHTGAQHFVLGYEHNLSKRTVLKAVYSQVMNQEQANYDFLYGVGNGNTTANVNAAAIGSGSDPRGLSIGMRHSF